MVQEILSEGYVDLKALLFLPLGESRCMEVFEWKKMCSAHQSVLTEVDKSALPGWLVTKGSLTMPQQINQ